MKKLAIVALVAVAASSVWAMKGTIHTDRDTKTGEITWKPGSKTYSIQLKNSTVEYPFADVTKLEIEKPKNLDQLIQTKNVPGLKKIVQDYHMLQWDKPACRALVTAYLESSPANPKEAYEVARKIVEEDKREAYIGDLAPAYWRALQATGRKPQLEACLKKAANEGDRRSSAEALMMRGDLIAQDDQPASHKKALIDAYLRVALLYQESECRETRIEALQRCATSFVKIGQKSRAEDMKTLAQQLMSK